MAGEIVTLHTTSARQADRSEAQIASGLMMGLLEAIRHWRRDAERFARHPKLANAISTEADVLLTAAADLENALSAICPILAAGHISWPTGHKFAFFTETWGAFAAGLIRLNTGASEALYRLHQAGETDVG